MDRLPNELLQNIFAQCTKDDARNARLATRGLAESCAQFVFTHFHLHYHPLGIATLLALATSGHGQHVKSITVDNEGPLNYDRHDLEEYLKYWSSRDERQRHALMDLLMPSPYDRRHTRQWLRRKRVEQPLQEPTCTRHPPFRIALRKAFAALPNLHKLNITDDPFPQVSGNVSRNQWPVAGELTFIERPISVAKHVDEDTRWMFAAVLDAMAGRATAAAEPRSHVTHLEMFGCPREALLAPHKLSSDMSDPDRRYAAVVRALQRIETLHVSLFSTVQASPEMEDAQNEEMMSLLRKCYRLRIFSMERYDWGPQRTDFATLRKDTLAPDGTLMLEPLSHARAPMSPLLGAMPPCWPHLQSLTIEKASFLSRDMVSFMWTHGQTISTMWISWCTMDDVKQVVDEVPRALVHAKYVGLRSLLQWTQQERALVFLKEWSGQCEVWWSGKSWMQLNYASESRSIDTLDMDASPYLDGGVAASSSRWRMRLWHV